MPNTYLVRVNYSFTKLDGQPFFGTYQAWFKYQSNSINGTFPNQFGQIVGRIYFAPAFFPPAPDNLGQLVDVAGKSLKVHGGKVTKFNGDGDYGALSYNLTLQGFDFAYTVIGGQAIIGEGSVNCEDPVQV